MKRDLKILLVLPLVFLMVGCGTNKKEIVSHCTLTSTDNTNGYQLNSSYDVYSTNNEVSKVVTEEVVTSDNDSILTYFEEYLKKTYDTQNSTYGGTTNEVTKVEGKVTSKTTIDYTKMDLEKYVKDNSALSNYMNKDNKLTKDGILSIYKAMGATCE